MRVDEKRNFNQLFLFCLSQFTKNTAASTRDRNKVLVYKFKESFQETSPSSTLQSQRKMEKVINMLTYKKERHLDFYDVLLK